MEDSCSLQICRTRSRNSFFRNPLAAPCSACLSRGGQRLACPGCGALSADWHARSCGHTGGSGLPPRPRRRSRTDYGCIQRGNILVDVFAVLLVAVEKVLVVEQWVSTKTEVATQFLDDFVNVIVEGDVQASRLP